MPSCIMRFQVWRARFTSTASCLPVLDSPSLESRVDPEVFEDTAVRQLRQPFPRRMHFDEMVSWMQRLQLERLGRWRLACVAQRRGCISLHFFQLAKRRQDGRSLWLRAGATSCTFFNFRIQGQSFQVLIAECRSA